MSMIALLDIPFLPNIFSAWDMTNQQLLVIGLLSCGASYLLVIILASVKSITGPVSFAAMFIGGMFANWIFRDSHFQILSKLQETLVYTLLGQVIAAIILIITFRTERLR